MRNKKQAILLMFDGESEPTTTAVWMIDSIMDL